MVVISSADHSLFWDQNANNRAKLTTYQNRIYELEQALQSSYSMISHELHPLLLQEHQDPEKDRIPYSIDASRSSANERHDEVTPVDAAYNLYGSMTSSIGSGESRFFGHAAAGWVSLLIPCDDCC
jgi:hypothetical protein